MGQWTCMIKLPQCFYGSIPLSYLLASQQENLVQQVQNEGCQTYWAGDYCWRHRHRQETGRGWRCHAAAPLTLWWPTPLPPYLTTTGTRTATGCTSGWCRPGHWSTWAIETTSDRLSIFWKRYESVFLSFPSFYFILFLSFLRYSNFFHSSLNLLYMSCLFFPTLVTCYSFLMCSSVFSYGVLSLSFLIQILLSVICFCV